MALFSECMLSCARKCLTPPTLLERRFYVNHLMARPLKYHQKQPTFRPYGRLKLIGVGLALTVVGIAMLLQGVHFVTVGDFINRPPVACHLLRNRILFKSDLGLS